MLAIYHRVYRRENFEKAAKDLFGLLNAAQEREPDVPRALYVDIDGHRNQAGGFDDDMFELQTEFGMGVLLQYVKEMHFPLMSVKNPKEQRNDIPRKLIIGNERNERDNSLEELYIENYSNTEFLSEDDVYEYMKRVSDFLKSYRESDFFVHEKEEFDPLGWLGMWHVHINELINELYNSFLYGNLLTVSAMTRALIECYIYVSILKKEKSEELIDEWWLCNMIHKIKTIGKKNGNLLENTVKDYCAMRGISFEEKWEFYNKEDIYENSWLTKLMRNKKFGFKALCKYVGEFEIYKDYQSASMFVHGQDVTTKMGPFTFYPSIYNRLYMMIHYIFKTIRLFEVEKKVEEEMSELEDELLLLGEKYVKYVEGDKFL